MRAAIWGLFLGLVMLNVYIGWDSREQEAYEVAEHSLQANASIPVCAIPLRAEQLRDQRMLWRPVTNYVGQMRDELSNAPQSTEFATSRFLVPHLQRTGWCLFTDCDMVYLGDVAELLELADPRYAVMVVKHNHIPTEQTKMDGVAQTAYPRKNWSSVVLWNCDHTANHRLDLGMVNWWPGELLHRFAWLRDSEIGELPAEWNWLVGVQPKPAEPKIAHFTLGGPWIPGWDKQDHDEVWTDARERCAISHGTSV